VHLARVWVELQFIPFMRIFLLLLAKLSTLRKGDIIKFHEGMP